MHWGLLCIGICNLYGIIGRDHEIALISEWFLYYFVHLIPPFIVRVSLLHRLLCKIMAVSLWIALRIIFVHFLYVWLVLTSLIFLLPLYHYLSLLSWFGESCRHWMHQRISVPHRVLLPLFVMSLDVVQHYSFVCVSHFYQFTWLCVSLQQCCGPLFTIVHEKTS